MKALRFYGQQDIRVEDIPRPVPKDDEVLIRVEWCGICGTDLHEYMEGPRGCSTPERPHPLTGEYVPVTMGHEFCGRVVEAPKDSSFHKGQAVIVDPRIWCQSCHSCQASATNLCKSFGFIGLSGGGGGLSEYVALSQKNLHGLPDTAPLHLAALIEPLAVAWHGITRSGVNIVGDAPVLVIGGGPIGLAMCAVLRAQGATQICVSEPTKIRRDKAALFADITINPLEEILSEKLLSMTNGKGIKVVFDCAGMQAGMDEGLKALQRGGTYLNLAGWVTAWNPRQEYMTVKELTFKSSLSYTESDYRAVVDGFINNKFGDLEQLVTSRILLDDVEEKGFKELLTNKEHIKILVTPRREVLSI